ncbi:MAG: hypothetical protein J6W00_10285 [Lentisphaeria bacterium]|nr:hypothetical protein [Lentisphaeria bacterium]
MRIKPFIKQQESLVPVHRRVLVPEETVKVPKRRGRKKSLMTLGYFLYKRKVMLLKRKKDLTREEFFAGLGIKKKFNFFYGAWVRMTEQAIEDNKAFQKKFDEKTDKVNGLTAIPILTQDEILYRQLTWREVENRDSFCIPREPEFGEDLQYFGFIMPDNCMVNDGICKGDRIAAAANLRPTHGDLVVCRIPSLNLITVRRYAVTCSPWQFDLYEGGAANPMPAWGIEELIYGVVVDVQRSYWPRRLPKKRPEVLPRRPIIPKNPPPEPEDQVYVQLPPPKEVHFETEEEKEEIAKLGCLQWKEYKKLIRIVRRERIKADGWPPRVPPRKGKKRGPKKNARKRAQSLAQDRADLNKFYEEYRKKMEKYGL